MNSINKSNNLDGSIKVANILIYYCNYDDDDDIGVGDITGDNWD